MKAWVLSYLRCPTCFGKLDSGVFESEQQEVMSGVLRCTATACGTWYPVVRGVPRLIPLALRADLTADFKHRFRDQRQLQAGGFVTPDGPEVSSVPGEPSSGLLQTLKLHTIENFGFEWTKYSRFGWDDPIFNIDREEQVFRRKALLTPDRVAGRLVLDAGCGNGRYSYWAAQYGGQVIGIDLGSSVDAAFANTRELPNLQIVQADIFNLPFADGTFQIVFSIGVLMHTGDAPRATHSLIRVLQPGGSLTVHLYGRGNLIYEWVDRAIRKRTTRLSIAQLERFTARLWVVTRSLQRLRLLPVVSNFIRLDPHPHCIFDWYAAPIATHHTYSEVKGWLGRDDLLVLQTDEPRRWRSRLRRAITPPTVTVRGEKRL